MQRANAEDYECSPESWGFDHLTVGRLNGQG